MKYLFSLEAAQSIKSLDIEKAKKEITGLIEEINPEAIYFSTIRRHIFIVVNVEDPHVELRNIFEGLSKWGPVTIDPVSTLEEFGVFMEQL
jgi:hypothetical protein